MRIRLAVLVVLAVAASAACAQASLDISEGWRFSPDEGNVGMAQGWHARQFDDDDWATLDAGAKWEDQGFPDVDGYGWYRKWVDVPAAWAGKKTWLVLGGVNDCGVLFCNGKIVATYGDEVHRSAARTPVIAQIGMYLTAGERNLIALRVYDRAFSGGLWLLPCMLTTDPQDVPTVIVTECFVDYAAAEAVLRITQTGLDTQRLNGAYHVEVAGADGSTPVARRAIPIRDEEPAAFATFDLPRTKEAVDYRVSVQGRDAAGEVIAGTCAETTAEWPGETVWPPEYQGATILNNLVAELLDVPSLKPGRFEFNNPRAGWVFFAAETGDPQIVLDEEPEPLALRTYPETGAREAMRFLSAGRHALTVAEAGGGRLVVRAVPELGYCYYPATPHIPEQGPYDWAFLERYVLPHVNMLVASGADLPEEHFDQWLREGRRWVDRGGLPGLHAAEPAPAQKVYDTWAARRGTTDPRYSGLIIDEFSHVEAEYFREWTDALARLSDDPRFAGKTFYAWCAEMYEHEPAAEFERLVRERNHRFAWEQYLSEQPAEDWTRCYVLRRYVRNMNAWKAKSPDVGRHMHMCLGFFSTPPCTLDLNPGVNFDVLLDWQFHVMATDPAYADLYGVMQWTSSYTDEETLRWGYRLFRHYCIEGSREPLTRDPLMLPHVKNPDFAEGLAHWEIEPAAEGSVAGRTMDGFSALQGRYPATHEGDTYLWMKRDAQRANRARQTVQDLEPGRLYSLKLISADLKHLDVEQKVGVSLQLENAEVLDEYGYQSVFRSRPQWKVKACEGLAQVYLNYHRVVFRAKGPTAELTISDAASAGGMADQELACNYVQLQPYHPPAGQPRE